MFFIRRGFLAALMCVAAGALQAQERQPYIGVVELFTSQGCSACPPADALMQKMIEDGKVLGLSYHVDYWDYLGWTDTLAVPDNSKRQYDYAEAMGRTGVYTPQVIINGREHANGSDGALIDTRLRALDELGQGLKVDVSASYHPTEIVIDIGEGNAESRAEVVVVYFERQNTVMVQRGDNAGKNIDYWHNVSDVQVIGKWEGKAARFTLPPSQLPNDENMGLAILLQRLSEAGKPKEIIGANMLFAKVAG